MLLIIAIHVLIKYIELHTALGFINIIHIKMVSILLTLEAELPRFWSCRIAATSAAATTCPLARVLRYTLLLLDLLLLDHLRLVLFLAVFGPPRRLLG